MNKTLVNHRKLNRFCKEALIKVGVDSKIANNVASSLVLTSLRGIDSHGIFLLPHYIHGVIIGRINPQPKYKFVLKKPSAGLLDANDGFGIDAGIFAMEKAIKMATKNGIGAVSVHNSSHFGAAAIYGLMAAKSGMIGLCFTSTESLVLPFDGKRPYLGTNPICFCAPMAGEDPFCLDMATSVVPLNKILNYKSIGKKLGPDWAVDVSGKPTDDPKKALWLLSFGGYKGYGLGIMVEVLSSILTGMNFGKQIVRMYPLDKKRRRLGHFFIAIDINTFISLSKFKKNLKSMCQELRGEPPLKKNGNVRVPGDPEKESFKNRSKDGIPMSDLLVTQYVQIANELGLKPYF